MTTHPLQDWIPDKLRLTDTDIGCRWLYVGDQQFDAPFFDETRQQCLHYPQNSALYQSLSTLDGLIELAQTVPAVVPTAFIFHVSRCGSTLLSQLLSGNSQHIVLSEVPLLDELLRLHERRPNLPANQQEQAICAALRLLGQQRTGQETRLFVKLDSWHIHEHARLRRLFPTVPMVLLYRSPNAVVASHRKQRGMHAVPGLLPPCLFGLDPATVNYADFDAYTAQVLTYYFGQFLTISEMDSRAFLLAYQPDGLAMIALMAQYLNLQFSDSDWRQIRERSGYHAKYPGQVFREDIPAEPAPTYLLPAISLYNQLETKRLTLNNG